MDAGPRKDDGRSDQFTGPTDRGGDDDFARWGADEPDARDRPAGLADLFEAPGREEAERAETAAAYDDHRRRFVASGGDPDGFDGLHLLDAAKFQIQGVLDGLSRRGAGTRTAGEHKLRSELSGLAYEAIRAQGVGRLGVFRSRLWPFGPPK